MKKCSVSSQGFAAPIPPDQPQPPKGLREEQGLCSCNRGPSKNQSWTPWCSSQRGYDHRWATSAPLGKKEWPRHGVMLGAVLRKGAESAPVRRMGSSSPCGIQAARNSLLLLGPPCGMGALGGPTVGREAESRPVAAQGSHVAVSWAEAQGQALSFAPMGSGHQLELGCQGSCTHFCCGTEVSPTCW